MSALPGRQTHEAEQRTKLEDHGAHLQGRDRQSNQEEAVCTPQAGTWASQPLLHAPRTQKQVEAGTSVSDALPLPHFPGSPGSS